MYERREGLYKSGLSVGQIAAIEGVTRQAIYSYLKSRGMKFRSRPPPKFEPGMLECVVCKREFYTEVDRRTCSRLCLGRLHRSNRMRIGSTGKLSRAYRLYAENPRMTMRMVAKEAGLSESSNLHSAVGQWARNHGKPWPLRRKR